MNLLRPPVLRAGSLDAARVPSRMGERLLQPAEVEIGHEAAPTLALAPAPTPAPAAPMARPSGGTPPPDHRARALREARLLARQHRITAAELHTTEERSAAITAVRGLIDIYGLTAAQLFGR